MINLLKSIYWEIKSYFVPEKMEYEITGECKRCGKCCNYMYSFDTYTEKEFKIMQFLYPAYKRFYIKGKDEFGNFIFACKYVTKEGLCSVYDKRLAMCKRYPMPKISYPSDMHEGCGFTVHKKYFKDYLQALESKKEEEKMIDTVIFDLDGTLLFTLEDLAESTNFALSKFAYPQRTVQEIRSFVGNGVKKLIERAIPNGTDNSDFDGCLKIFKENYSENMYNKTRPYDGVVSMLETLKSGGFKTAVVSNKFDSAVKNLCETYFPNLLDCAIGESENVKRKPSPDSVFEAMKCLDSKAENSLYVGDSEVDIQTAKNAGLPCLSVDWGYKDKDFLLKNGAKVIVSTPQELIEAIKAF